MAWRKTSSREVRLYGPKPPHLENLRKTWIAPTQPQRKKPTLRRERAFPVVHNEDSCRGGDCEPPSLG